MHPITDNHQKVIALCNKYMVKALNVFGSILTSRLNENNDVDFSATFHPEEDLLVACENRIQFTSHYRIKWSVEVPSKETSASSAKQCRNCIY